MVGKSGGSADAGVFRFAPQPLAGDAQAMKAKAGRAGRMRYFSFRHSPVAF